MSPMLRQFFFIYIAVIRLRLFYCRSIVCREKNEDLSLATVWKEPLQSEELLEKLPWNKLLVLNKAAGRTLNILFASDVDFLRRRLNLMNECGDKHNTSEIERICNSIIEEQYPACHSHNKCLNSLHKMDTCRMTQYREDCKQRHTGLDSRKLDDFRKLLLLLVTYFKSIYHQDRLTTKVMYEKGAARNNGMKSRTLITVKLHHRNYTFFMELPLSPFDLDEAGTMVALEAWTQCNPESQIVWSKQAMHSSSSVTKVFHSVHTHIDIETVELVAVVFRIFSNIMLFLLFSFILVNLLCYYLSYFKELIKHIYLCIYNVVLKMKIYCYMSLRIQIKIYKRLTVNVQRMKLCVRKRKTERGFNDICVLHTRQQLIFR